MADKTSETPKPLVIRVKFDPAVGTGSDIQALRTQCANIFGEIEYENEGDRITFTIPGESVTPEAHDQFFDVLDVCPWITGYSAPPSPSRMA